MEDCRPVRREALYNVLTKFGIPLKLGRLIKMYLKETYSIVNIGNNLYDAFSIGNGLTGGDTLSSLFSFGFNAPSGRSEITILKVNVAFLNDWARERHKFMT